MKKTNPTTVVLLIVIGSVICLCMGGCLACGVLTLFGAPGDFPNWGTSDNAGGASPKTGEYAPNFQLETLNGNRVSLSDYRGKPVLVNFWAIWCEPCREEMPVIQSRFQQHTPNLIVLAVEGDSSRNALREYVRDEGITFSILLGTEAVSNAYAIFAYPTSFFIDAEGVIRSVVLGSMTAAELDAELAKIGVGE